MNQENIKILSRSMMSTEIEVVLKNLPTKKSPWLVKFTAEFYKTF
jgi:hypothetical protein